MTWGREQLSIAIQAQKLDLVNEILSSVVNITDILNEEFKGKTPIQEAYATDNADIIKAIYDKMPKPVQTAGGTRKRKHKRRGSTRMRKHKHRKNK